tara:strand:+ start:42 stop:584 length:543 start_codon:yes stop_codon:yes gene_type:complete
MGILGFGSATKIEDFKIADLKKKRLDFELQQDRLMNRIRKSQEQHDAIIEAASEPGLNDAEIEVASYKAESALKVKTDAESQLQQVISNMQALDGLILMLENKKQLETKGVWKDLANLPQEQLEGQILEIGAQIKEGNANIDTVTEVLQSNPTSVKGNRSAAFTNIKDSIIAKRKQKSGN